MTETPDPAPAPGDALSPNEIRAKSFVEHLAKSDAASAFAQFDATMAGALPIEKLEATWAGLQAQVGPFQGVQGVRSERVGAYDTVLVTCSFGGTQLDAKLAFDGSGRVSGLFFIPTAEPYAPPSYSDRAKYETREVVVGQGPWKLPGTLTLPVGPGPHPAVVLVHGSGPGDRDETVGPNKPFSDLAMGLASRGVAVLRYDKRTRIHAKSIDLATFTVDDESVDDAVAGVRLLASTPSIDPARIFVAGHSLGGFLAPRIATREKSVAGIAILAGSTRDLPSMMLEQMHYIGGLDGRAAPEEEAAVRAVEAAKARVAAIVAGGASKPGEVILGAGPAYWKHLAAYDALATVRSLDLPVLVVQGGRDYQVTEVDFDRWKAALAKSKRATTKLYPALNHLFAAGEGKSSPEEYQRRTPVDVELVEDLARFVGRP